MVLKMSSKGPQMILKRPSNGPEKFIKTSSGVLKRSSKKVPKSSKGLQSLPSKSPHVIKKVFKTTSKRHQKVLRSSNDLQKVLNCISTKSAVHIASTPLENTLFLNLLLTGLYGNGGEFAMRIVNL